MERVNLPFFYELGENLNALAGLTYEATKDIDYLITGLTARSTVSRLLGQFSALTVCRASGTELVDAIDSALETWREWRDKPTEEQVEHNPALGYRCQQILTKAKDFQTVLIAELQTLAAYQITQKGIYSTTDLIERAENIFMDSIKAAVPELIAKDISQAGRCLAFDLPTAAGFHIWRAVEGQLRAYYKFWVQQDPGRKTWAALIKELRQTQANAKTLGILDQIRDLHRNPIMHPDIFLSSDEVSMLFGIGASAIATMVQDQVNQATAHSPALLPGPGSNVP